MSVYQKQRKDGTIAWFYDFMYRGIRYRGVGGATKSQAIRVLDKKRTEVLNTDHGLQKTVNNPRIEDFAETYLARRQHLRFHKRDNLSVRTLLKFFKGTDLMSITPSKIEDYIGSRLKDGLANGTINRELTTLKRMFSLANKWGDAIGNPVKEVDFLEEPPGRTRFLSIDEATRLISCAEEKIQPIIITSLNTGMRRGEILSLKWNQIHLDNVNDPSIELPVTKANRRRYIPLNDDMIYLVRQLEQNRKESDYVFLDADGKTFIRIDHPFKKALKKAGIEDFRFHDLRHTFASHYIMAGGDLLSLKEILGHSDLKMVERYSHLASSYKRKMINNLNGRFKI